MKQDTGHFPLAFALLGALLGLLITGETLSIYAQLGMRC